MWEMRPQDRDDSLESTGGIQEASVLKFQHSTGSLFSLTFEPEHTTGQIDSCSHNYTAIKWCFGLYNIDDLDFSISE